MSEILDQSMNIRPSFGPSTNHTSDLKAKILAKKNDLLNESTHNNSNIKQVKINTTVTSILSGSSNGSTTKPRVNSASKNKSLTVKSRQKPIPKKPIIEYNSLTEIPIDERTALYSTWTPLSDENANQKVKLMFSLEIESYFKAIYSLDQITRLIRI
jgi:hypothetical protein